MDLYTLNGCPYCEKVLKAASELGIILNLKPIEEENNLEKLIDIGGKNQVPFLVDEETKMYESDDIIEYLQNKI